MEENKITFENLVDGKVLLAALEQFKLKMDGKLSDLKSLNDSLITTAVSTAIANITGSAPETFDTFQEIAEWIANHDDVYDALNEVVKTAVKYEDTHNDENPDRKSIVLNNNDNILGKEAGEDGAKRNLLVLSTDNIVEVGSEKVKLNLNGSEDNPTYNNKKIALLEDIEATLAEKFPDLVDGYVTTTQLETELNKYTTTEDLQKNYVTAAELNALAMTEQQARDLVNEIFTKSLDVEE